jgi:predicted RecB family nuclease
MGFMALEEIKHTSQLAPPDVLKVQCYVTASFATGLPAMRLSNGRIILSPSDVVRFGDCEHASALDLRFALGEPLVPKADDDDAILLQKKGEAHETLHLAGLKDQQTQVVEIDRESNSFELAACQIREAMIAGAPYIYQGALGFGSWQGYSDFLERVEEPSNLGPYSYEVLDTKLKHRAVPRHALQLAIYSRAVADIQGRMPVRAHVKLGTGERVSFPIDDVRAYADRLAQRLETFVAKPWPTTPEPVAACKLCRWRDHCADHWWQGSRAANGASSRRAA